MVILTDEVDADEVYGKDEDTTKWVERREATWETVSNEETIVRESRS